MSADSRGVAIAAVRGASITIATGIASRAVGLVATLVITFYLSRETVGAVSDAAIVLLLAGQLTTIGVGQYLIATRTTDRAVTWHATVIHNALGVVAIAACWAAGAPLGRWLHAPALAAYMPGLAIAALLDRISFIPTRILARDMEFRAVSIARAVGEIVYAVSAVVLAAAGFGGASIVAANVLRSSVRTFLVVGSVPAAEWLTPSPYSRSAMRALLRFGVPFSIGSSAELAARRVDNLIVSSLFGAGVVGSYNLAYNLADVPAVQVGEQIGDVLLPSFARIPPRDRPAALVRAVGLLSLFVFPLAVGLGATAPSIVAALLPAAWRDVAPMLAVLAALSVSRPLGWVVSGYLQAADRPRTVMALEVGNLALVVGLLVTLGRLGPLFACASIGVAFTAHALASVWIVCRRDGVAASALFGASARPLLACGPMALAVIAARAALEPACPRAVELSVEILAGALAYVLAAFAVARPIANDAIALLRRAIRSRRFA